MRVENKLTKTKKSPPSATKVSTGARLCSGSPPRRHLAHGRRRRKFPATSASPFQSGDPINPLPTLPPLLLARTREFKARARPPSNAGPRRRAGRRLAGAPRRPLPQPPRHGPRGAALPAQGRTVPLIPDPRARPLTLADREALFLSRRAPDPWARSLALPSL
jgi:hypothetical protein